MLRYQDWILNLKEHTFTAKGIPVEFTGHEFGILELLVKHPKKVFTKQEIFELVWQENYFVEDKTIHVHITAAGTFPRRPRGGRRVPLRGKYRRRGSRVNG